jgi:hypothetical protein
MRRTQTTLPARSNTNAELSYSVDDSVNLTDENFAGFTAGKCNVPSKRALVSCYAPDVNAVLTAVSNTFSGIRDKTH